MTESPQPPRKPRHTRATTKRRPAAALTPREAALLEHLTGHQFLTAGHLAALDGGSEQRLSRILQRLFHEGFVERVHPRELRLLKQYAYVYALTEQGKQAIASLQLALPLPRQNLGDRNKRVSLGHVGEHLILSDFWVGLTLALRGEIDGNIAHWEERRSAIDLRFAYWQDGTGRPLGAAERVPPGAEAVRIIPDAWLVVEAKPGTYLNYFLEAHSGAETHERVLDKYRRYWRLWRTGEPDRTRGVAYQWRHIAEWRVLTVCPSAQMAENLRQRSREADERGRGSDLFLFASTEEADWRRPETFLGPALRGGKGGRFTILGEERK